MSDAKEFKKEKVRVKSKDAAPVQITAEQILREANERQVDIIRPKAKRRITDEAELKAYQTQKRGEFEDNLRRNQQRPNIWTKFARFEESQGDLRRMRSVYERANECMQWKHPPLWIKYAEAEMRSKQPAYARNVLDRAVTILPRIDSLWLKYAFFEETLGEIDRACLVFERWMDWSPPLAAWQAYVNMLVRFGRNEVAHAVAARAVVCHCKDLEAWVWASKFEEKTMGDVAKARAFYTQAVDVLGASDEILIQFAKFEERVGEVERARAVYKYAIEHVPDKTRAAELLGSLCELERKSGDEDSAQESVLASRRMAYNDEVTANPFNYDVWFDWLRLETAAASGTQLDSPEAAAATVQNVRELFHRAVSAVPPAKNAESKGLWSRYIWLWLFWAFWEEDSQGDVISARTVYAKLIAVIPHELFTFSKVWILFAQFEIRHLVLPSVAVEELDAAQTDLLLAPVRRLLGLAIGKAPSSKLFEFYIKFETRVGVPYRVRTLYEKWLETSADASKVWMEFITYEKERKEFDRVRGLFQAALERDEELDSAEGVWRAYIEFEREQDHMEAVREAFRTLTGRTNHVNVWLAWSRQEIKLLNEKHPLASVSVARKVFVDAHVALSAEIDDQADDAMQDDEEDSKDSVLKLLEAWGGFESSFGSEDDVQKVRRLQSNLTGAARTQEEQALPLSERFQAWKKQKQST
eukprot:NODE_302_length_2275_cov_23.375562_g234_i0.p1 GENE.NODE_302_length_2275_cov_23.375562_g234_i0~~NODE_302_length_2275_cov_23.375562_g234_i0.p1  ORF type:complete len:698 (+),score=222.02 NODE_302_length_2275_cov_23.375562_g234_i0:120-2213(+)